MILLRSFCLYSSYNTKLSRPPSGASLLDRLHKVYVYIPYGVFVALEIFGGAFMRIVRWIRLFSECYKIAGFRGLKACAKYLFGLLQIDEYAEKVAEIYLGGYDA